MEVSFMLFFFTCTHSLDILLPMPIEELMLFNCGVEEDS